MKRLFASAALLFFTGVMTANASLKLNVASNIRITTFLGVGTDSVWYCDAAYRNLVNGTINVDTAWVDSVYSDTVRNVFAKELEFGAPLRDYLVNGVADSFKVPATGQYTFSVDALGALFVFIDGQLLTDAANKVFLYPNIRDLLVKGIPSASGYKATRTLTQGNHSFVFYFWKGSTQNSLAGIRWTVPGGQDTVAIPSSAFGKRKNYGPLDVPDLVTFGPKVDSMAGMTTLASGSRMYFGVKRLSVSLYQGETLFYCWKVDGAVVKRSTDSLWDTIYLNTTNEQIMHVATYWAETSLGRKSAEGGSSSTSFYIMSTAVRPHMQQVMRAAVKMPEFMYAVNGRRIRTTAASVNGIPASVGIFLSPSKEGAAARKLMRVR